MADQTPARRFAPTLAMLVVITVVLVILREFTDIPYLLRLLISVLVGVVAAVVVRGVIARRTKQ